MSFNWFLIFFWGWVLTFGCSPLSGKKKTAFPVGATTFYQLKTSPPTPPKAWSFRPWCFYPLSEQSFMEWPSLLDPDRSGFWFLGAWRRFWEGAGHIHIYIHIYVWDVSENRGKPLNHPLKDRVFHYKPSILGYPYFRNHPYRISGKHISLIYPDLLQKRCFRWFWLCQFFWVCVRESPKRP